MFVVVVVKFLFFSCGCMKMVEKEIFVCFFVLFAFFFRCFFSHQIKQRRKKDFVLLLFHRFFISKRE